MDRPGIDSRSGINLRVTKKSLHISTALTYPHSLSTVQLRLFPAKSLVLITPWPCMHDIRRHPAMLDLWFQEPPGNLVEGYGS